MARINIEISEELHRALRIESAKKNVPIKSLIIKALQREYGSREEVTE